MGHATEQMQVSKRGRSRLVTFRRELKLEKAKQAVSIYLTFMITLFIISIQPPPSQTHLKEAAIKINADSSGRHIRVGCQIVEKCETLSICRARDEA